MATTELDKMEYATNTEAQNAYVSDSPSNLQSYSEPTIKTEGDYSLKVVADTSSQGKKLSRSLPANSDLTGVKNLKFDIRSNRTGQNVKLGLYSGNLPTGGTVTDNSYDTESNLILHYKLNENTSSTFVEDFSPSGNDGTSTDNTEDMSIAGKINTALNFGGNSVINPVTLTNRIVFGDYATINCFVYNYSMFSSFAGNSDQGVARFLYWYSDGNMYLGSNTFPEQVNWPASGIDFSGWHMITIIKNQNIVELFIDLVSQGVRNITTIADIEYIGAGFTDFMQNAGIDDFRVYDGRMLSMKDLTALLNGTENSIVQQATHRIHTFTENGTFSLANPIDVEILVVAGGGGGGSGGSSPGNGGGGGAGGLIYDAVKSVVAGQYSVIVGDGGAEGVSGDDSSFDDLVALGGGGGGAYPAPDGQDGGSGGGAGQASINGEGDPTQGHDGGTSGYAGGGGGGANEAGDNAQDYNGNFEDGGNGGDGIQYNISGAYIYYCGGGGGSTHYDGSRQSLGGLGGGGKGAWAYNSLSGENGVDGTGGGGGAGGEYYSGGSGGKGIVIIKYAIPEDTLVAEITPDIVVANQFQTINWNISSISDVNKCCIGSIKIEIVNDNSANTFYIDNLEIAQAIDIIGLIN